MTAVTRMAAAIQARLRAVFHRGAVDREMRDEMALHLEQATERLRRRGLHHDRATNRIFSGCSKTSVGKSSRVSPIMP